MKAAAVILALVLVLVPPAVPGTDGAAGADAAAQPPRPANQVQNGTFEQAGAGGVARHWTAGGGCLRPALEPGGLPGGGCQRLECADRKIGELWQRVPVSPGETYFFHARVRATDSVLITLGQRSLAYTGGGQWQTLADLVRPGQGPALEIRFRLGGGRNGRQTFRINDVQLRAARLPPAVQRRTYPFTELAANHSAAAWIVYPAQPPLYRELARRVQAAVRQRCGVALPLVDDLSATESDRPVLKAPYRDAHLILLGRLGINRSLWPAYNRFLAAVDGYYPGGDGCVLRTASNVLRNGKNHLIVGGSSEAGAARAVQRFVARLASLPAAPGGNLILPWLLDVELDGPCRAAFLADDRLWSTDPHDPALPRMEPGYQTVVRWYMNAMAYYWTGWPGYRQRTLDYLAPILRDRAATHHYIVEFFLHAYDMLDDSGLLTPEQIAAVDGLILQNFDEFLTGSDLQWMALFNPPYDQIELGNSHAIAAWTADLALADFLHDYFPLQGDLAEIVAYRRAEKHGFFEHLVARRWKPSLPRSLGLDHHETIVTGLFRYALEHDRYEFFASGNARRALVLEDMPPERGRVMDDRWLMGVLAHYYRDGRYVTLLGQTGIPLRLFQNRYVGGVHRYTPGNELSAAAVDDLAGVRVPPWMPQDVAQLPRCTYATHRQPALSLSEAFECATLRNGFAAGDDFLRLAGLGEEAGAITHFNSGGRSWLGAAYHPVSPGGADNYFQLNAVSVLRTDRWMDDPQPYPGAARLNWIADLRHGGGVSCTLEPFMTAAVRRDVFWIRPGLYVVRDVVTALEDGTYAVRIGWLPEAAGAWDGRSWTAVAPPVRFRLTPCGPAFRVLPYVETNRAGVGRQVGFHHAADGRLRRGQHLSAVAVLEVAQDASPLHAVAQAADDHLALVLPGGGEPIVVLWGPVASRSLASDAQALVLCRRRLEVIQATRLSLAGTEMIGAGRPVSLAVDWATGTLARDDGGGCRTEALPESWKRAQRACTAAAAQLAPQGPAVPGPPEGHPPDDGQHLTAVDATAQWKQAWSYAGLLQSARIDTLRHVADDVYDLGRQTQLGEIRAAPPGRIWRPGRIPDDLRVALADPAGGPPPADSPQWRPIRAAPLWRAAVETGNYGRAIPRSEGFQVLLPAECRARFVRGRGAAELWYYDADRREARTPLRVETADLDGHGQPQILVAPAIWPPFLRDRTREDTTLALLQPDGREIFHYAAPQSMQDVRVLELDASGRKQIVVLTVDAQLRVLGNDGQPVRHIDLYAMHQAFDAVSGRANTRAPAGGFTMPYSLGTWRPDVQGRRGLVVARYGGFSFLDGQGHFEGLLASGGYVQARMLPAGLDFNGDGHDEQLCLSKFDLFHLDGDATPRVADPGGPMFFPQVYAATIVHQPGPCGHTVDGSPVILFQALPCGGTPRFVVCVRSPWLAIYDARQKRWAFTWVPPVSIRAAAVTVAGPQRLEVVLSTEGNLLWHLAWNQRLDRLASFAIQSFDAVVTDLAACAGEPGRLLIAAADGLFDLENDAQLALVARGSFQAVHPWSAQRGTQSILAVTSRGDVQRFDRAAAGAGPR